jgi:hypothetical protein
MTIAAREVPRPATAAARLLRCAKRKWSSQLDAGSRERDSAPLADPSIPRETVNPLLPEPVVGINGRHGPRRSRVTLMAADMEGAARPAMR